MKRLTSRAASPSAPSFGRHSLLLLALVVPFGLCACVFDAPGDRFYRTLWVSEDEPFSDGITAVADWEDSDQDGSSRDELIGKMTIEFLCGGSVTVTATGATGSYGTYDFHDTTAYFSNLRLTYMTGSTPIVIILEEAHRTDDLLLISWHYYGSKVSGTTRLVRKGSYETDYPLSVQ